MRSHYTQLRFAGLLAFVAMLMAGCHMGNAQPRELIDEFVVGAYCGPPYAESNLERYQEVADADLDILIPANGAWDGKSNLRLLDLAAEVGIRLIPYDGRILKMTTIKDAPLEPRALDAMVSDYGAHPAFAGYAVRDEPNADMFDQLRRVCDYLEEKDPRHLGLINLFPSYGSPQQLGFDDFRDYVRDYLERVEPAVLCYDHYPLRVEGFPESGWHKDLKIVREESRRANVPFWLFMQAEGIEHYLRVPARDEVFWQVNTALAYGTRGIWWFSYWTPVPDQTIPESPDGKPPLVEQHHGAMIGVDGEKTPLYDHVRDANRWAHQVGDALMGWDNAHVARWHDGEMVEGSTPLALTIRGEDASVVVGVFKRRNAVRMVVASDTYDTAQDIEILWDQKSLATLAAHEVRVQDGACKMGPGGCVVFEIK